MKRAKRVGTFASLFLLGLLFVLPVSAYAQSAAAKADIDSGAQNKAKGFKVGKFVIHPGLSLQNVYDTNVQAKPSGEELSDYILRILAGLKINYPDPDVAFTLDANAGYAHYFGLDEDDSGNDTGELSNVTGQVRATLTLFPSNVVGGWINDNFRRMSSPEQVATLTTTDRITNIANAMLSIKPGGGQLRFFLGYTNSLLIYEEDAAKENNWVEHKVVAQSEWEFLPETAAFVDFNFAYRTYNDFELLTYNDGATTVRTGKYSQAAPDAMPIRFKLGLKSRFTDWFSMTAAAGYGNTLSKNGTDDFSSVVANLEGRFDFSKNTMLRVGFTRDFAPAPTYWYTANNKVYTEFKQMLLNEQVTLYLYGSFDALQYGEPSTGVLFGGSKFVGDELDRLDMIATFSPSIKYAPFPFFQTELGYRLSAKITDYELYDDAVANPTAAKYDYTRHEIFLKLEALY